MAPRSSRRPVHHEAFWYALPVRHLPGFLQIATIVLLALLCALTARAQAPANQQPTPPQQQQPAPPQAAPAQPGQPAPSKTSAPQAAPPQPVYTGPVIVLDPAHGGTDTGARGENGAIEKDLVLDYARMARSELQSQGFHVVLTRNDDSNPSYADRAAVANAYRNAIFISLHVSSTGAFGTVRSYFYQFGSGPNGPPASTNTAAAAPHPALVAWDEAQLQHVDVSHRLADTLQAELARQFNGSPAAAAPAAVRELRSINAPAVAIEVSSVSVKDSNSLAALAGPLAISIARGLQSFRAAQPQPSGEH